MYAVYKCDLIGRGESPKNETRVCGGFATANEAMAEANARKRADRSKSYMVGFDEVIQ